MGEGAQVPDGQISGSFPWSDRTPSVTPMSSSPSLPRVLGRAARSGTLLAALVSLALAVSACADQREHDDTSDVYCRSPNAAEPVKKVGDQPCLAYPENRLHTLEQKINDMEYLHRETWEVSEGCADPTRATFASGGNRVQVHIGSLSAVSKTKVENEIARDPRYELQMIVIDDRSGDEKGVRKCLPAPAVRP